MESFGTFQKLPRRASAKTDYAYDVNGNLTKNLNKDIGDATVEGIVYNHLNLPWQVTVKNKGTITYLYDAAGNKLEKKVAETSPFFSAECSRRCFSERGLCWEPKSAGSSTCGSCGIWGTDYGLL